MSEKMKSDVAEFFDKYAVDFSSIYEGKSSFLNDFINNHLRKSMKIRFIKTIEGCDPVEGKRVIDIGCGSGQYAVALAKKGAGYIYGIDFAQGMIDLARRNTKQLGVDSTCRFELLNFITDPVAGTFDYAILMGFMDYIKEPRPIIKKALSIAGSKAFFSFPAKGGILAWQRKLRYMLRCRLFFYDETQIRGLFKGLMHKSLKIEKIDRDFFVTVNMK